MTSKLKHLLSLFLVVCIVLSGCGSNDSAPSNSKQPQTNTQTQDTQATVQSSEDFQDKTTSDTLKESLPEISSSGTSDFGTAAVKVHYIDVGQGDSILIESDGESMLIDAGTNNSGPAVVNYLNTVGITTLDWVIGTHPHEDHIGGLDNVIRGFDVKRVMLPPKEHTTKTFEDVLDAIESKSLSITLPEIGDTYELGNATFTVLGPVRDYGDDLNNWSVILRLDCGSTSFIFTGDAESGAEMDVINAGLPVKADVLKVGHHGSTTSTCDAFLSAVSPSIAVISVSEGNDYGHPHKETMSKLKALHIPILRTDLSGTIIIESDGKTLRSSEDDYITPSQVQTSIEVHITKSGAKYHKAGCSALSKSDIPISLEDAKAQGYEPCKQCNPPE